MVLVLIDRATIAFPAIASACRTLRNPGLRQRSEPTVVQKPDADTRYAAIVGTIIAPRLRAGHRPITAVRERAGDFCAMVRSLRRREAVPAR